MIEGVGDMLPSIIAFFFMERIMRENKYQAGLIRRIETRFKGSVCIKNDANLRQGIPDLTVLWGRAWFILESKGYEGAPSQPNQSWYIERFNEMSFAAVIHPGNEEEIFREIERTLQP